VDDRDPYDAAMRRAAVWLTAAAALALAVALAALDVGEAEDALDNWQALTLGLVQGLTELLPISSSGHLILVPWLFDWDYLKEHDAFNQTFDVALHLGTLVAVVSYFRHEIAALVAAWFRSVARRRIESRDERIAWFVFVATIPAAVVGAVGESFIAERLGEPWQIAILLAVFALVLLWADRRPSVRKIESVSIKEGFAIGVAQSLELAPGVSRSGITISAGRFLRLDRDAAARLSFLLLVPTTLGAVLWKGITDVLLGDLPAGWQGPFVVGMLAAFASGLLAIVFLLNFVRRHTYAPFVVYRLIVAVVVLGLIAAGVRDATF
jgi:undecaprenyl-diphosphatase